MSGFRNKTPDDIIKNRQEYLDNLNAEIKLYEENEQAVRQYKETGQLPAVTQMKDNRTVEQKLLDYEKLKQSIREDLSPVATPLLANMIIDKVLESPLNVDNNFLVFFAQRAPDIVKNMQKSYKFGIKGDENDAQTFVNFIASFYNDKNKIVLNTKQMIKRFGTQNIMQTGKKLNVQNSEILETQTAINNLIGQALNLNITANFRRYLNNFRSKFNRYLGILLELFPDNLQYKMNAEQTISLEQIQEEYNNLMLVNAFTPQEQGLANDYQNFFNYLNDNVPQVDYLNTLSRKLQQSFTVLSQYTTALNEQNFKNILDNIFEQLEGKGDINAMLNALQSLNRILGSIRRMLPPPPAPIGVQQAPMPPGGAPAPAPPAGVQPGQGVTVAQRSAFVIQQIANLGLPPQETQGIYDEIDRIQEAYDLQYITEQKALEDLRQVALQFVGEDPVRFGRGLNKKKKLISGKGLNIDRLNEWYRTHSGLIAGRPWTEYEDWELRALSDFIDDDGKRHDISELAYELLNLRIKARDEDPHLVNARNEEERQRLNKEKFDDLHRMEKYPMDFLKKTPLKPKVKGFMNKIANTIEKIKEFIHDDKANIKKVQREMKIINYFKRIGEVFEYQREQINNIFTENELRAILYILNEESPMRRAFLLDEFYNMDTDEAELPRGLKIPSDVEHQIEAFIENARERYPANIPPEEQNPEHAPEDFQEGGGGEAGAGDEGAEGHGLKKSKSRIIRGSGIQPKDYKFTKQKVNPYEGVQEDPRYIKFGRYLVNTKRLKDDVLSLRREKGTPIASLPAYKMTRPFKNVVNKIIGGGLPSSEDFDKLTDDEKRYLHKVSKEADLSHKLEIPTPSKDEEEKDEHLFNVYKGEIMAGNDNKDMVKKFKLLLMKLSRKNYINKNEANDILEMLTNAGY